MFIVSREYGIILNLEKVVKLFTGGNRTALVGKQMDGRIIYLQEYDNEKEAKEAISIVADEMCRKNIVYVPTQEEVKARIALDEKKWHHATGKKTKGHGGS